MRIFAKMKVIFFSCLSIPKGTFLIFFLLPSLKIKTKVLIPPRNIHDTFLSMSVRRKGSHWVVIKSVAENFHVIKKNFSSSSLSSFFPFTSHTTPSSAKLWMYANNTGGALSEALHALITATFSHLISPTSLQYTLSLSLSRLPSSITRAKESKKEKQTFFLFITREF